MSTTLEDPNGILLIDKPAGLSSFGVVARVRRRLSERAGYKVKVGHTGTLDPFATGLMIVVVGKACKQAERFSKLDKVYLAMLRLGATSSTGDPEGEITVQPNTGPPTRAEVEQALQKFVGQIDQTPPIYSAIKINGQRAYRLARAGHQVEMPKRQVTISSLDLLSYDYPELTIRTHVSSGTYIRSLANDVGQELGTGAYTIELRREKVGDWRLSQAQDLDAEILHLITLNG